jgi:RecQ family ATP-dependent DNA helicase
MELNNILNTNNINIEQLQKGLKHIGLNLSRFEDVPDEQALVLLELFRLVVEIDPKTVTRFTKIDLRHKLDKVLKGLPVNNRRNTAAAKEATEQKETASNQQKNNHQNSNVNRQPKLAAKNKKLGKVKFFDSKKGFGYVRSLMDNKDYFIHVSKLITSGIDEDDIVCFDTVASRNNPEELNAINVSNKIPVFIYNKDSSSRSFAYPLSISQLEKEIALTEKYETGFATVTAHYRVSSWKISIIPSEITQNAESVTFGKAIIEKLLPNLSEYKDTIEWLTSLLQSELTEAELNSIYSDVINNFEQKTIPEINKAISNIKDISFFTSFLDEKKKTLNKISFVLWALEEVEELPNPVFQEDFDIWRFEILPSLDWKPLQQVLTKLHSEKGPTKLVEESYRYLISQGWEINSKEELQSVSIFLEVFKTAFSSIPLEETNFRCNSNHFYVDLYNTGLIKELSEAYAKQYIDELKTDDEKAGFIERLPSDKILSYYYSFPSLSNYQEKYITDTLESEFSKIDFLCFDLESDGEKINEFAWKNRLEVKSQADFKKKEEGISELVNLINLGSLTIGQNIKEFDLVILANHGAAPSSDIIWDTLEMEMLLNPERFSYGLKTKHNAKSDTELTYRLFKNQLSRIIISQNAYPDIKELLPSKVIDLINQISNNPIWALLDFDYFLLQSNEFFRPNPTNQNISEQTFNQLTEKLNEEGNRVVIAPEFLWNTLSHQFDLTFYSNNKSFLFCLNKEKIEAILGADKLLKAILFRFVDTCILKGIQPYFQYLPIVIRLKLTSEQITLMRDNIDVDFGNINQKPICIKPTDIEILKQLCDKDSDIKVIIVGNELYNLTSKLQLGQDLDFPTIFDKLKNEPIWLQMSGGKSFINLEQSHCRQLGITEFPEFVQNIWLEKIGKGKFKVWCNLNFKACINVLPIIEPHYIDWVDETFTKTNSFIIRPDARQSGYVAEEKRVNPESLNRKIYWVYQFKLFEGIGNINNPKVLIINDDSETEKLLAYARRKGYFIPDTRASLARQVELLHTDRSPKKILITSFLNFDKIISSNYTGPLDFIWDSFLLQEKLQMLRGKVNKEDIELTENASYIPSLKGDIANKADFDTYKLFRLHKPLVDYYYKMVIDNNQESNLFLCDTRLADFVGIEKSLELKSKHVRLWNKFEDYETDYKEASDFFPSDILKDNNFDVVEAKQILRQLFLPKNDNGDFFEWYDYQDKCLDEILPAKKDLLISLPTGAGKSVLFQAPALFRSTFTNKLNIVISPLRALMHDQVEILHKMGLYSNVEYLSGDKSQEEIKDIYRRIVGGEITLLYITPERFRSRSFENCLLTRLDADNGLEYVVFDEAHCISQWGQEFRPDYLNAGRIIADKSKSYSMTKLLFSATISEQVFEEISKLMPGVETVEGTEKSYNPVRDHIKMDFKHNVVEDDRLLEVANYLKSGQFNPELSRAIIFVKSRKKVEECSLIMSDSLKDVFGADCSFAEKVGAFHAGMDAADREDTYEKYKTGEILILFATKAFGMGMDIPNIHFVTHYSPPSTFEDFLQEVGRAGRNEKQRLEAGFNNSENPIKTLCLTANNDFAKLKDQLHESRISWHEIKGIKQVLEEYIARFKPLTPDTEIPIAVPFNLNSNVKVSTHDETDTKFRIALHWLERLERIKLGYFTITHLEFDSAALNKLAERINKCPDIDCEKVCHAILELLPSDAQSSEVLQISIASLRSISKLSLENLFSALLKNHSAGILKLLQDVVIEPTIIRLDETNHCKNVFHENEKYPALRVIFSFARIIMSSVLPNGSVRSNGSSFFEGEELDDFLMESVNDNINFKKLPWTKKDNADGQSKEYNNYIKDIFKKRSKHAFTIIRLLGKTKHETQMEKVTDGKRKGRIRQSIFNGFHKKEEWSNKITQLENDCIKLLDYVGNQYFENNIKKFNWADIVSELSLNGNVQYLSDLLFILSVLGYCKTGGLLPSGIEIYLHSTELIDETQDKNNDKIIYNEFNETQEIRELKLISLQVLSKLEDDKKDVFIKGFFASKTKLELINHLQNIGEIDDEHPIFKAFRGDAIKYQEVNRLNDEQREIYFSDVNQNINVVAGPGSGKTHTLTLRVARLVYYKFANPEEILVLAYNRAVVSELKERLGKLFKDLGFGNLAKRIRIVTFHGLAKKYCQEHLEGLKFEEWEPKLLQILKDTPGVIMNQLAPLKHILVDEFQDIDEVRMDLLYCLNDLTKANLFIIGDPNQSIYGYSRDIMDPYHYYNYFDNKFNPSKFTLLDNHRSYPDILSLASHFLTLPEDRQHLIPKATKNPNVNFLGNYVEVIDNILNPEIKWWDKIQSLMDETNFQEDGKVAKYKQIAILFRTNNEVYRGFQRIKGLHLSNIRIRIQGNLPYEFTRIRECHEIIIFLKSKLRQQIPLDFKQTFSVYVNNLIIKNQNWNHFYIRVVHALVLEYLDEQDENQNFDDLLEFITELTHKDDGQLYKIYEKHQNEVGDNTQETEIVLTTMHKVKGLEFDSVIIAPSHSSLAFNEFNPISIEQVVDTLNEEKRLAFVAYTRARFRLLVFNFEREKALLESKPYILSDKFKLGLGIPAEPGISKLNIGWAAKEFNYKKGVNDSIKNSLKSGDEVSIKLTVNKGFEFYEIIDSKGKAIGQLSMPSGKPHTEEHKKQVALRKHGLKGFVINEIVQFSYDETLKSDEKNGTTYAKDWCLEARNQGYIYLVDFAGFGVLSVTAD